MQEDFSNLRIKQHPYMVFQKCFVADYDGESYIVGIDEVDPNKVEKIDKDYITIKDKSDIKIRNINVVIFDLYQEPEKERDEEKMLSDMLEQMGNKAKTIQSAATNTQQQIPEPEKDDFPNVLKQIFTGIYPVDQEIIIENNSEDLKTPAGFASRIIHLIFKSQALKMKKPDYVLDEYGKDDLKKMKELEEMSENSPGDFYVNGEYKTKSMYIDTDKKEITIKYSDIYTEKHLWPINNLTVKLTVNKSGSFYWEINPNELNDFTHEAELCSGLVR
jgi:hypothetical protein